MLDRTFRAVIATVLLAVTATPCMAQGNAADLAQSAVASEALKQNGAKLARQLTTLQPPKRESSNPAMLLAVLGLGGFLVVRRANLHQ